jgi:hypothetical protein
MPRFSSIQYRDCAWCGVKSIAMEVVWTRSYVESTNSSPRAWAGFSCPRCGGVILVELTIKNAASESVGPGMAIDANANVAEVQSVPADEYRRYQVDHLPEHVARFLADAIRVLDAGVPDGAAVQLRRTLEAAAAHQGIREHNLVTSIEKLIEACMITRDFGRALHHIRKIGNIGAHYTDERITNAEAERALKFTVEVLRNLFEVPGELAQIENGHNPDDDAHP